MTFVKVDSGIIDSSIWSEPYATRLVWITFLAKKDENGFVNAAVSGIQRAANVTMEECLNAIKTLESPDKDSRTSDFEGRRIEKVPGGWIILNHEKYRLHSDIVKEQTRERVKRYRENQRLTQNVTQCNVTDTLPSVSVSTSVSLSSKEKEEKSVREEEKTWKNDFPTYQAEELAAYTALINDSKWIAERQKYHGKLDILKSLEKAHVDYWSTEEAWKHKASERKTKKINWKLTYTNALTMPCNRVWKNNEPEMMGLFGGDL